ncbi:hypothetical protein [Streptomyces sp. NPDC048650]|uniref:hypothetical protein n=1 Tax=unclassified Streptomyces TaxID=2593676 RepID=UPI00372459E4
MSADHIDPSRIPTYTGDLEELETRAKALKKEAGAIRDKGADIHSEFQGLRAYYTAPEAEQLFATTKPVATKADRFADDLEKVGGALDGFAAEVRPLIAKLHQLEGAASHFVATIKDDEDWQYNPAKVAWNRQLVQEVSATVQAFWAAEVAAADKITALVHGTQWSLGDGKKKDGHTYGLTKKVMTSAGNTPWGKVVEEKRHWYDPRAVGNWIKHFVWDGTVVDGVWGTLKGLWSLTPWSDNFGAAWKSMAHLATVATLAPMAPFVAPLVPLGRYLPDSGVKTWMKDSLKTTAEVGKSLVAWDQWSKDSGRAAGAASFNVVTAIFTRGGAGAARTGAEAAGVGAKIANAAGKVGKVGQLMDPTTHIATAVGAAAKFAKLDVAVGNAFKAVKTSTALSHLRDAFAVTGRTSPSGEIHLPNGQAVDLHGPLPDLPPGKTAVYLPDGAGKVPPGSVMHDADTFLTPDRRVVDANGIPKKGAVAMVEPSAADREVLDGIPPERAAAPADHELAAVGAEHRHQGMADAGGGDLPRGELGPQASRQSAEGAGAADNNVATGGGVGDNLPGGATSDLPGGHAGDLPAGSSASHEPPTDHTGSHGAPSTGGQDGLTGGHREGSHGDGHAAHASGSEGGSGADHSSSSPYDHGGPPHEETVPSAHSDPESGTQKDSAEEDATSWQYPGGEFNGKEVIYPDRPDPDAVKDYAKIRAMTDDVEKIADNTNIDAAVIQRVKENLFLKTHDCAMGPGVIRRDVFFVAYDEIAYLWKRAIRPGGLKRMDEGMFRGLVVHEYVESRLLEAGLPYVSAHPEAWTPQGYRPTPEHFGAHDISPESLSGFPVQVENGTLKKWPKYGLEDPGFAIADDFSNLDELVDYMKARMGL